MINLSREFTKRLLHIEKLEREQNHSNQYNRQENIELTGIPDKDVIPHDKLEEECIKLLKKIGVTDLKPEEIVACHRLPKKNDEDSPNVIIRFVNRKRAIECFKMKKNIKQRIPEYPQFFILENLCPRYRTILDECKKLKRNGHIKKVWTFKGIVNIKTTDNEREKPKKIYHTYDLEDYIPEIENNGWW